MAGLGPAIHVLLCARLLIEIRERQVNVQMACVRAASMAGSSPAMT
jgi:hypothetical protein